MLSSSPSHAEEYTSDSELLTSHDDEINYTEEQNSLSAKTYIFNQNEVIENVLNLAQKLDENLGSTYQAIGTKQILEIKKTLQLSEKTTLLQNQKNSKLLFLHYDEIKDLNWDTPEGIEAAGEIIYRAKVKNRFDTDQLGLQIPGVGKVEPVMVDGWIIPRVVEEKSGVVFLLIPEEFPKQSPSLDRLIAIYRDRANHGQGRPTALLTLKNSKLGEDIGTPSAFKFFKKPSGWAEKTKNWWKAMYEAPTRTSAVLTAVSVVLSVATTEGISAVNYFIGSEHHWDHTATALGAGYTVIFGLWASFYGNITDPKDPEITKYKRLSYLKRAAIGSATFSYSLQIMNHGIDSLSIMTMGGWLKHLAIWGFSITKVAVGDQWKKFAEIREYSRANAGNVNLLGTEVKQSILERILVRVLPQTLRRIDLFQFNAHFASKGLPASYLLYYSSYIWAPYLAMRHAELNGYVGAEKMRADWNKVIHFPRRVLVHSIRAIKRLSEEARTLSSIAISDPQGLIDLMKEEYRSASIVPTEVNCNQLMSGN